VGVLVLGAAVGLLLSLYGPAIPRLREAYGVGGGGSALVLTAHFAGASPDCLASSPAVSGPERSSRSSAFSSLALSPCLAATAVWNITVATLEARPAMASCSSSSDRRPLGDRVSSGAEGVVMPASVAYI
jgi:hypothetical protein